MDDTSRFSARVRRPVVLAAAALALASLVGLGVHRVVEGPAMSAAETAAFLRSYTAGDRDSYACERLWLDHWDYRCSFRSGGELIVVDVRVNGREIIEQTAP